jgi:hypothetical protein
MAEINAVGITSEPTPTKLRISMTIINGSAVALNYCIILLSLCTESKFSFSKTNTKFNI